MKKIIIFLCALLMCVPININAQNQEATILFTSDLHSHLLPTTDLNGNEIGGYARLMSVINEQKEIDPYALLVDGGDFSMGSLFQSAYTTSAIELRIMGAMGYDVTTLGNHEFDYLNTGLADMLNTAKNSKDSLPQIVNTNYLPPVKTDENYDESDQKVWDAFNNYGVKDYTIIERNGLYYAVFGINGEDSDSCAPNSGMILHDITQSAQKAVDNAVKECKEKYNKDPIVICLSHSGTDNGKGEDYELAKNVDGIDIIVSGHTHTVLEEPIIVNNTIIVSCGEYGQHLGVVKVYYNNGKVSLKDYELISVDSTYKEDPFISDQINQYEEEVNKNYLEDYNLTFDTILTYNPYQFETTEELSSYQHESPLTNLFTDAYKWMVEKTLNQPVDMAITALGVVRDTLPKGDISVSDVFNTSSLGVGTEGELVNIYLTGKDLKTVLEIDASVSLLMNSAQLYTSGVQYSYNTNRMMFNKVDSSYIRKSDGTLEEIKDNQLYSVVTGMYAGNMLGTVEKTSYGLLSVTPRNQLGEPISTDQLSHYIVKDQNNRPVKEWYAIASYLMNMDGEMNEQYSKTDGRKTVYSSLNPVNLLSNANIFTYGLLSAVLIILLVISILIYKRHKRVIR